MDSGSRGTVASEPASCGRRRRVRRLVPELGAVRGHHLPHRRVCELQEVVQRGKETPVRSYVLRNTLARQASPITEGSEHARTPQEGEPIIKRYQLLWCCSAIARCIGSWA